MSENDDRIRAAVEYAQSLIQREVAAGFERSDNILRSVLECAAHDLPNSEPIRAVVRRMLGDALKDHYRAQAEWPERTDCDRLDEAFADLESLGIVSRQNFTCCGTCGSAEIGFEIEDAEKEGWTVRGYTFYHMQDTEAATEYGDLYLSYGAVDDGEEAALGIAREVIAALVSNGLKTDWNGSWSQRIGVNLDWKRRRPVEASWDDSQPTPNLFDDSK